MVTPYGVRHCEARQKFLCSLSNVAAGRSNLHVIANNVKQTDVPSCSATIIVCCVAHLYVQ